MDGGSASSSESDGDGAAVPAKLPRPNTQAFKELVRQFVPNSASIPKVAWSLTMSAQNVDVPRLWLTAFKGYMRLFNLRGAASLERGSKKQRLHVQGTVYANVVPEHEALFAAHVKQHLMADAAGGRVTFRFKVCKAGQPFSHMLGYVQKDHGQVHYQLVTNQVTEEELQQGRDDYGAVADSYRKDHITITKGNLGERVWGFWRANYQPFLPPADVLLLHMLRTTSYVPDASWVAPASGWPADFRASSVWLSMITRPSAVTLADVRVVFFAMHRQRVEVRYFNTAPRLDAVPESTTAAQQVWYDHADEPGLMRLVCCEVRSELERRGIDFKCAAVVDQVFLECAPASVDRQYSSGAVQRPPPAILGPAGAAAAAGAGDDELHSETRVDGVQGGAAGVGVPVSFLYQPQPAEATGTRLSALLEIARRPARERQQAQQLYGATRGAAAGGMGDADYIPLGSADADDV